MSLGEPLLVQKRTVTSSNSRPNTSTSATFDQVDQTSDGTSTDENASAQNRNERSPVNILIEIVQSTLRVLVVPSHRVKPVNCSTNISQGAAVK